MKTKAFIISMGLILGYGAGFAQRVPQSQVPSLLLNHFGQHFPNAYDVEWEIKGNQYCVEFETKLSKDHEVWYDNSGKLLKHKEDISKRKLPDAVHVVIRSQFKGYRIDDTKKITTTSATEYMVELNSLKEDLKVVFDDKGAILSQYVD